MLGEGSVGSYAVASFSPGGSTVTATVVAGTLTLTGQSLSFSVIAGVVNATLSLNGSDVPNVYTVSISAGSLPTLDGKEIAFSVIAPIEPARLTLTGQQIEFITPLHGGGSDRRKPKNYRTGFEPVRKYPPQKIEAKNKPAPLPPYRLAPRITPVEPAMPMAVSVKGDLLGLQDDIYAAQDLLDDSDIEEILALQDGDVGEILMLLDSLD